MTTTKTPVPEITVTVSAPYRVVGFHGGRYGASQWQKRDYTVEYDGVKFTDTSKAEIQSKLRRYLYRATGSNRASFTFVNSQEG